MKRRALAAMVAAILLLAGCKGKPSIKTERDKDLSTFIDELDTLRKQEVEGAPVDVSGMAQDVSVYGDYSSMARWQSCGSRKSVLSAEEAREDVTAAFDLLHDVYGGYHYFGGDEVFAPLRETLLSQISDGEKYTARELKTFLRDTLSPVLRDGHFAIEGALLLEERQRMFLVPGLYLDEIGDLDPTYVKRTIDPEGKLAYCFAALSKDGTDLPTSIGVYADLAWMQAEDLRIEGEPAAYEKEERDGLTFLTCRTMGSRVQKPLLEFSQSGGEYRELDAFVIDLRGNRGGSAYYWREWLAGFLGQKPQGRETIAVRWPDTGGFYGCLGYLTPQTPGTYTVNSSDGRWNENDRTIFVLTDGQTSSSAEWFVEYLHTLGHVVVVGSNTSGMMLMGGNFTYYLPNSGLALYFGSGLQLFRDGENLDGVGLQPDLWIDPARAADAVTALWKYGQDR